MTQLPNVHEIILNELSDLKDMVRRMQNEKLDSNGMDTEKYLTVQQTSEFLDCTKDHVYDLKQQIPFIQKGSRIYFMLSDLHEYMKSGRRLPKKK